MSNLLTAKEVHKPLETGLSQIKSNLIHARDLRSKSQWKKSLNLCTKIYKDLKKKPVFDNYLYNELYSETLFSIAVSYAELGKRYKALDYFQRASKINNISDYRKGLCLLNVAHLLSDFGAVNSLQSVLSQVPSPFYFRIKMQIELQNGRITEYLALLDECLDKSDIPLSERKLIFYLFCETQVLFGVQEIKLHYFIKKIKSWCFKNTLEVKKIDRCGLSLLDHTHPMLSKLHFKSVRLQLQFLSFKILKLIQSGLSYDAQQLWKCQIDPLLVKHNLRLEFMPCLSGALQQSVEGSFNDRLLNALGIQIRTIRFSEQSYSLNLNRRILTYKFKDSFVEINLISHPTTFLLLSFLSQSSHQNFSKEDIHLALTRSKYSPHLHDDRIHKLVSRLKLFLKKHQIPSPLQFTGQNRLVLTDRIQLD